MTYLRLYLRSPCKLELSACSAKAAREVGPESPATSLVITDLKQKIVGPEYTHQSIAYQMMAYFADQGYIS